MSLHARIAAALDWPESAVLSFSLPALRDLVRPVSPKLAAECSTRIRNGSYIIGDSRDHHLYSKEN